MCPIVPIFTCGLLRSNFSLAATIRPTVGHIYFLMRTPELATDLESLERGTGFEPATIGLEGRDSTTELPPRASHRTLEPGTGIEPLTSSLPRTCFYQLSYPG